MSAAAAPEAVIVAAARSPIGRAGKGSLREMRADDLGVAMVRAALAQVPELDPREIDEIIVGCGQPAGEQGYGIGRVMAVMLGLDTVPASTVQRYCASSLEAIRMARNAVCAGDGSVFVAAGVEAVSRFGLGKADGMPGTRNPVFPPAQDPSDELGDVWVDPRARGGLPDVYMAMGRTAEHVAGLYGVSRTDQDDWALRSQRRAEAALNGFWARDITPVTSSAGTLVERDDCPRPGTTMAGLGALAPVFGTHGTVTAGNACPLNDGAAAVVVMSAARARELGVRPRARIVATAVSALSPEIMGVAPVEATRRALRAAGMSVSDLELVEINEAFAAQVVPCIDELGLDPALVNPFGGAIAVGHPFGMTGARIATTLLNGLEWTDRSVGLETMCAAGGQGMAMIVERLT